jgi:xanthine dehydrogenase accessory factor
MTHPLESPLAPLARDFRELRSRGEPFVLATVVSTEGSTYRKAGTQMLIADAKPRGLLSGGCLEVDLVEHARDVLESGKPRLASYDMRGEDDGLFGIGSGCEGAMRILLQRVAPEGWQPLAALDACVESGEASALALIVDGPDAGRGWWRDGADAPVPEPEAVRAARKAAAGDAGARLVACTIGGRATGILVIPLRPPPLLLLCGAGIDAAPLAAQCVALGFAVVVCDHRPALLQAARFPQCVLRGQPAPDFVNLPELARADAAIVMSHHLASDLAYLAAIADRPAIGYVGVLGPAPRRDRLLRDLGPMAGALRARLRAPVGLDIGARTPEAIALAAAGELHAWVAGRGGGPWHEALEAAGA